MAASRLYSPLEATAPWLHQPFPFPSTVIDRHTGHTSTPCPEDFCFWFSIFPPPQSLASSRATPLTLCTPGLPGHRPLTSNPPPSFILSKVHLYFHAISPSLAVVSPLTSLNYTVPLHSHFLQLAPLSLTVPPGKTFTWMSPIPGLLCVSPGAFPREGALSGCSSH